MINVHNTRIIYIYRLPAPVLVMSEVVTYKIKTKNIRFYFKRERGNREGGM